MKFRFVFDLPYLVRFSNDQKVKVSIDGTLFKISCKNSDTLRLLPWIALGRSEIASLVFEHSDEGFVLDNSTLRTAIAVDTDLPSLDAVGELPASILMWGGIQHQEISRPKLLYLLNLATRAFNKFIRAYSVKLEEVVNFTYLEPMYENQYPYGVRIYIDGEFVSWTFPVNRISLIPLEEPDREEVERVCTDVLAIDPVREVFFHSQVLFMKREYELSLISCHQFLESIIDRYLATSTDRFHRTDEGTSFEFTPGKRLPVSVMRKYHDVLLEMEGRSLFIQNDVWWDDLDIIVGLRNSLLHDLKSFYSESKRHYDLRFADRPIVHFKSPRAPKLSGNVSLETEFPRLIQSAARISSWLARRESYVPMKTLIPFRTTSR